MHSCDVHEECLDGTIVCDVSSSAGITLHPVHEDFNLAFERLDEVINFAILGISILLYFVC